ncbi:MAG: hypothetical protein PF545_01750, partial [Elusimicrobia bacterium]|nr:hypothetical protein [Elusimicrobiota bacterium]
MNRIIKKVGKLIIPVPILVCKAAKPLLFGIVLSLILIMAFSQKVKAVNLLPSTTGQWHFGFEADGATLDDPFCWEELGATGSIDNNGFGTPHEGSRVCRFDDPSTTYSGRQILSSTVTVTAGTEYRIGAWYYVVDEAPGGKIDETDVRLMIEWYDNSDTSLGTDGFTIAQNLSAFDTWEKLVSTETAPAGAVKARLQIDCQESATNDNDVYTDDAEIVEVIEVNTAPAIPDLATSETGQFEDDGTTTISVGGESSSTTVVLKGLISDSDDDTVKLEIEIRDESTAFSDSATHSGSLTASGSTQAITVSGLTQGTTYHWQARTVDSNTAGSTWTVYNGSDGDHFYIFTTPPDTTPPSDPTGLAVTDPVTDGNLNISWTANVESDLDKYWLYRSVTSGVLSSKVVIATVTAPTVTYADTGLANNTTYYYQVTALDTSGNESGGATEDSGFPTAPVGNSWGDIVITEALADTNDATGVPLADEDNDEFIELYNRSGGAIDVEGWLFDDGDLDNDLIAAWNMTTHGYLTDVDVTTNTTVIPSGYYAVILDSEYNLLNQPYDFPANTIVLTCSVDSNLGGTELLESELPFLILKDDVGVMISSWSLCAETSQAPGASVEMANYATHNTAGNWAECSDDTQNGAGSGHMSTPGGTNSNYTGGEISGNTAPNVPDLSQTTETGQFEDDGTTQLAVGTEASSTTVVLKGLISDPDDDTVKLEIEIREKGTAFSDTATDSGSLVASGSTQAITVAGLTQGTTYHWQARTVDSNDAGSAWTIYNGSDGDHFYIFTSPANDPPSATIDTVDGTSDAGLSGTWHSRNSTVTYTLTDSESDTVSITVEYSKDNSTWFSAAEAGGDGTSGLTSSSGGISHEFIWASATDLGSTADGTVYIKITPDDGSAGTADTSTDFGIDNEIPPTAAIPDDGVAAESGTSWTNSPSVTMYWDGTISSTAAADGSGQGIQNYDYKWDSDSYATTTNTSSGPVTLADGSHTFYVITRDDQDNETAAQSHTVQVDITAPGAIADLTATDSSGSLGVDLSWSAASYSDAGIDHYNIYRDTNSIDNNGERDALSPIGTESATSYSDSSVTAGTTYYYVVCAIDYAVNEASISNNPSVVPSSPEPVLSATGYHFEVLFTTGND